MRIIATSDLHAQLLSYDYFANRALHGSGLAQIACLIDEARASAPASILLDNGDFLQGGALADIPTGLRPHPAITAFNTLGYDAAAIGNHEFDYGLAPLRKAMGDAHFPLLSANLLNGPGSGAAAGSHFAKPATLIERHLTLPDGTRRSIRIGVFGLTPTGTLRWNARQVGDHLRILNMEETARHQAAELRAQGADLVICLAHTGVAEAGHQCDDDDERAVAIAATPGIDAVVAGHSHLTFPDKRRFTDPQIDTKTGHISGVPVVQPGHEGSHLGIIDLWLRPAQHSAQTRWQVLCSKVRLVHGAEAVAGMPARKIREAAAPLRTALAGDHRAALSRMRQRLGEVATPLSTFFANVADSQALRLVGAATALHARARLAGGEYAGLPVVSLVSAYRSGGRGGPLNYADIPAGPMSLRHVCSLYPFANSLTAVLTTGAELAARLDRASAVFRQIVPGQPDQMLMDPDIPGFRYEVAYGASYRIDLAATPAPANTAPSIFGGRIRELRINDRRIASDDPVILVMNSYLAGDPQRPKGPVVLDEGRQCTDVIADYIRDRKQVKWDMSPGWRFEPMPQTSVLFDTGSAAVQRIDSASSLLPEPVGLLPSGFSRFRLHL